MIAINRVSEPQIEADDESSERTVLADTVRAYFRFLDAKQVDIPYEARLELKRQHHAAMRGALERRGGFTLVEMLVAVALVVLMMTLFAAIFQMATSAMSKQKGIAENDQRVRLVTEMLRNDLGSTPVDVITGLTTKRCRTFRVLIPWGAGEAKAPLSPLTGSSVASADRSGYFGISENDPTSDIDDNLYLTVSVPNSSSDRIFGRAGQMLADKNGNYGPNGNTNPMVAPYWPNQPVFDAFYNIPATISANGSTSASGSSTTAEVCYFLRNGTLYRRSMMVRVPNVPSAPTDPSPADMGGAALSLAPYTTAATPISFWKDFDYSAFFDSGNTNVITFHGLNDLQAGAVSSLFNPQVRWGFDNTSQPGAGRGLPREYIGTNYIGRFTHRETSDSHFLYPGVMTNNPMSSTSTAVYGATTGIVQFAANTDAAGPRVGEDIIMSNVLAFDIKVWDPAASVGPDGLPGYAGIDDDANGTPDDNSELGTFGSDDGTWVDIGNASGFGWYCAPATPALNPNVYFSNPNPAAPAMASNRYDTWGPTVNISGNPGNDAPPYRPVYRGPDGKPGVSGVDDDFDGKVDNASELGWPGSDDFAPLNAIRITIRFYDITTNQVRDVTAVYSTAPK